MPQSRDIALIGKGYWGPNIARNLVALRRLKCIADLHPDIVEETRKQYPDIECFQNLNTILKDPEIRAVCIATPAYSHAEIAIAAMKAGKDVFIEKPMTATLEQARQILKVSEETSRLVMVGHLLLYHPAVQKIKSMIQNKELGNIQYIYSNRLNFGQIRTLENTTWSFAPHDIAVINYLLDETPYSVAAEGTDRITQGVHDVTLTDLEYPSGVKAHIFVSWLHPYKEQRMVIIGSKKMVIFSDTAENKLTEYAHEVAWISKRPVPVKAEPRIIPMEEQEPLRLELEAFLEAIDTREPPIADAKSGYHVVEILDASDRSLALKGKKILLRKSKSEAPYYVHDSAYVHPETSIGEGTKIWHYSHIMKGAQIGQKCILGQGVHVAENCHIGNHVKIQNHVSVYTGVTIEDDVFLGPSCVLTNVSNPRSEITRHSLYEKTLIRRGATIGANATIVCGHSIGQYAFVAAGAVITRDVPDYALMMGNPARQTGWMSRHGHPLKHADEQGIMKCPESGFRYQKDAQGNLKCLDWDESTALPEKDRQGQKSYREIRELTERNS